MEVLLRRTKADEYLPEWAYSGSKDEALSDLEPELDGDGDGGGGEIREDSETLPSSLSRSTGFCLAAWVSVEDMLDASKQNAYRSFVSLQSWNQVFLKLKDRVVNSPLTSALQLSSTRASFMGPLD